MPRLGIVLALLASRPWLVAAEVGRAVEAPLGAGPLRPITAMPNASLVPSPWTAPGAAMPLLTHGGDLRLDPAVQASMANPVPITAVGLRPEFFTKGGPAAEGAPAAAAASGHALAEAASPKAKSGVEAVSTRVFDGRTETALKAEPEPPKDGGAPQATRKTDYLRDLHGERGDALLAALREATARRGVLRALDPASAQRALIASVDRVTLKHRPGVRDAYSQEFLPSAEAKTLSAVPVFPQDRADPKRAMSSDLHQLLPVSAKMEAARAGLPFGEVTGTADYVNDAGAKRGGGVFEPPNEVKGQVARAMLYLYLRYQERGAFADPAQRAVWNAQLPTMLAWNQRFPPSTREHQRNNLVEVEQGNRNPFIDEPGLADRIGLKAFQR